MFTFNIFLGNLGGNNYECSDDQDYCIDTFKVNNVICLPIDGNGELNE